MCGLLRYAGGGRHVRILYHRLDPNLLPQDASEFPTAGHPEPNADAVSDQLQRRSDVDRHDSRRPPVIDLRPVEAHVDVGQAEDGAARGVLLHRVRV